VTENGPAYIAAPMPISSTAAKAHRKNAHPRKSWLPRSNGARSLRQRGTASKLR
jgi:hypothetical protein